MESANQRYVLQGHKTIVLIDGLDHVMREVDLQASVLRELPPPNEIPEGFVIVLSGQPQAFLADVIPAAVAASIAEQTRRVEVSGLSRPEAHTLLARLSKPTTGEERDAIYESSLGNPLILTYIVALFERTADTSVSDAIQLAGHYQGRIDQYYQERLSVPLQSSQTRTILGLLCRAAPTLPTSWLSSWPEKDAIEDVYARVLAPFVRVDDGQLIFIHDSLIAFLKVETRSRLPGSDPAADERRFYSVLADRSEGRSSLDAVGRARVGYLVRAARHSDVLAQLSSDWLRPAVHGFLPYDHLHPLVLAGYTAAVAVEAWSDILRLLLLSYELDQRTSRLDPARFADVLLDLDEPLLALLQIRSSGRLLVSAKAALEFAGRLWRYAQRHGRSALRVEARALYLQAKPISSIYTGEPIETAHHSEAFQEVQAWSDVAAFFEPPTVVADEIRRLVFTSRGAGYGSEMATAKAGLLFRALDSALGTGCDLSGCQAFIEGFQALGLDTWRFAALLLVAESRPSQISTDSLRAAYSQALPNDDLTLAYAWFLTRYGDKTEAKGLVRRLSHIRFQAHRESHSWSYSDITYTIRLRWLQEVLGVAEGPVPPAADEREEAYARLEQVARTLGYLRAAAAKGHVTGDRPALFRSLLLFHNKVVHFSISRPHHDFVLQTSRNAIYEQVGDLAKAMGAAGLKAFQDIVVDLTTGPGATQFSPQQRRQFARLFHREGTMSTEEAVAMGLSSTEDASDDDPTQRQEACFEIAKFLHSVGDEAGAHRWRQRASEVSAGAGSHKDHHMSYVGEWLARSIARIDSRQLYVLDQFARAVEVAGGRGGADGAAKVLQLLVRLSPARAPRLAVNYLDRKVLNVSEVLRALIGGGIDAQAHPELLCAIYGELLSLIAPDDTSKTAAAILRSFPHEQQKGVAMRLMQYVRTNTLPSHRAPVARALQDALGVQGIEGAALTEGLEAGRDDSSRKRSLYRRAAGEVETHRQVAERLSEKDRPDTWNPNPEENTEFDWWAAIKMATLSDEQHFDSLVARFPPPDYREVDVLVQKAEILMRSGDRRTARELVERALARSRDGSWIYWLDGAQKLIAFRTLMRIDHAGAVRRAREQFFGDLSSGKLSAFYLLDDIGGILELLEIEWPADAVVTAVSDYLEQVTAASPQAQPYEALAGTVVPWSPEQALCRFVADLLGFPVVDVGVAARRALARYVSVDGKGFVDLLAAPPWWNAIQLEHLLAVVQVASPCPAIGRLRAWVEGLNRSESLAVRSVAKRIVDGYGWTWKDIRNEPVQPVIVLASEPIPRRDAGLLLGGDVAVGWDLHQVLIQLLERAGLDTRELWSEFDSVYRTLARDFPWADDHRLQRWMTLLLARVWLHPRAIIGREAAMRVFGKSSLSGRVPPGAEDAYDDFYPIYDSRLELHEPIERPQELRGMEWRITGGEGSAWLSGTGADSWSSYPQSIEGLSIIGERTWIVRPEWEWPREERYRGMVVGCVPGVYDQRVLSSAFELTYEMYVAGRGQDNRQLIVTNAEHQMVGPAYRWTAINANFARALGWHLSDAVPFQWLDEAGSVMVESKFWKDGWIWLEPPRFESLGEGWFVTATKGAIEQIRTLAPESVIHLWVERHSHGDRPYEGKWHLSIPL